MAPNERARENHDELFPDHVSTLAVTYHGLGAAQLAARGREASLVHCGDKGP